MSATASSSCRTKCSWGCLLFSLSVWLFITIGYLGDWDWASPLTIFPYWCWAIAGGIASYAALRLRCKRWHSLLSVGLWFGSVLWLSDNLSSILRLASSPHSPSVNALRVVTLNCAGDPAAMREVASYKPDIVLLQEIPPSSNVLSQFATELFGNDAAIVAGYDCAIISHGKLELAPKDQPSQYVRAMVNLPSGRRLAITSLRLVPPVGRLDLWNPDAWRATIANRRLRREQLLGLMEQSHSSSEPEIIGGDFNATANDTTLRLLTGFHDAHRISGRGFGNTALNGLPIARPDQIWVRKLEVISSRAFKTKYSDHRLVLVIIDFPTD
jgi:hypothetical protein